MKGGSTMRLEHDTPRGRARFAVLLVAGALVALGGAGAARAQEPADSLWTEPVATDSVATVEPAPAETVADAAAPAAEANARLGIVRKVRLDRSDHNVVRSGPGEGFAIVGVFRKTSEFVVVAKNGMWYGIQVSPTQTGWIHASLCREFDDLSDLEFRPNPKLYSRTGSYVVSGYSGGYAFDRKSNSLVVGGRLGYYIFDRLQAEAGVAWTHVHRPAEIVESLFDLSLEAEDFHMLFYQLNLTWQLLPGRQMVPFIGGGVGSAIMQGETEPSWNVGAGTLLFLSKRMAMRWEVRDYHFSSGPEDARRSNDNIEFSLGTEFLF